MKYKNKQKVQVVNGFYAGTVGAVIAGEEEVPPFWKFWKKKAIGYIIMPKISEEDMALMEAGAPVTMPGPFFVNEEDLQPFYEKENTGNVHTLKQ